MAVLPSALGTVHSLQDTVKKVPALVTVLVTLDRILAETDRKLYEN